MWPHIIDKARRGGINVIQTYIFWNIHEPVKGKVKLFLELDRTTICMHELIVNELILQLV